MEITRNIILDLLPLYLAGEASSDTQALVKHFLETDPELAEIARSAEPIEKPQDIPLPIKKEDQMEAYKEAQRMILRRTVIWGAIIAIALLAILGLVFLVISMFVYVG